VAAICAGLAILLVPSAAAAGGSCVIAKKLGNSLAIEWVAGVEESGLSATEKAKQRLLDQGHKGRYIDVHPQALTDLPAAHVVIIKSSYQTIRGKMRTSYGCGFDAGSTQAAEVRAIDNLRSHSWGWKPETGYEVLERFSY
jgi:GMP synthase-like glutamine amidotransferase